MLTYADGALGDQGGIPGGLVLRIRQNGPGTSHCSLAFIQDSLKRSRVYFKKKIARPDRLPFLIAAFLNNSRHAGAHFRLKISFHTAGKVGGYGNLGAVYRHDRHFRHGFAGKSGLPAFILPLAGRKKHQQGYAEKKINYVHQESCCMRSQHPSPEPCVPTGPGSFSVAI